MLNKVLKKVLNLFAYKVVRFINSKYVENIKNSFLSIGTNCEIHHLSYIINPQYISIGDNFQSSYNLRLEAWDRYMSDKFKPQILIGNNVSMNTDVHIGCINKIILSDNVMIASRVCITDHSHGNISKEDIEIIANKRRLVSKGPVIIEENVWIGEGVCIFAGVSIGKNSIIGANAVVTKSFPDNSIIAGIPAKLLKELK